MEHPRAAEAGGGEPRGGWLFGDEITAITGHRTLRMVPVYTASADQERMATAAIVRLQAGGRR